MGNRDFASLLSGGLSGASTGGSVAAGMQMAGMVPGPWTPWLLGGGAALGAVGAFMGNRADEEEQENDPVYQAMKRREKGMSMFRSSMGRAMRGSQPKNFGEMLNGPA